MDDYSRLQKFTPVTIDCRGSPIPVVDAGHRSTRDTKLLQRRSPQHSPLSTSPSNGGGGLASSPGPIRHKNRIDTSPYGGSTRFSTSDAPSGGYQQHLSPPDHMRRFHSDSSLHQTVLGHQAQNGEDAPTPVGSPVVAHRRQSRDNKSCNQSPRMYQRGTFLLSIRQPAFSFLCIFFLSKSGKKTFQNLNCNLRIVEVFKITQNRSTSLKK